jgi:hypothetical protein
LYFRSGQTTGRNEWLRMKGAPLVEAALCR